MRKYVNSQASQHEMKLIQMGAQVEIISSQMCYVKFALPNVEVAYVYNINKNNRYYLERVKPYPLPIRDFEKEEDVIKVIEIDIKQFKNACQSKNINEFVEINQELNKAIKEFEDLFLYYNVPTLNADLILEKIKEIHQEIFQTKDKSERVFFEKEPESFI